MNNEISNQCNYLAPTNSPSTKGVELIDRCLGHKRNYKTMRYDAHNFSASIVCCFHELLYSLHAEHPLQL